MKKRIFQSKVQKRININLLRVNIFLIKYFGEKEDHHDIMDILKKMETEKMKKIESSEDFFMSKLSPLEDITDQEIAPSEDFISEAQFEKQEENYEIAFSKFISKEILKNSEGKSHNYKILHSHVIIYNLENEIFLHKGI